MRSTDEPTKMVLPFAADTALKNTIPVASQIGITPGAASYTDGFPPLNFLDPILAGGKPPDGKDMNGILNAATALGVWFSFGAGFAYDQAQASNALIPGYPAGARVMRTDKTGYWINTIDNNLTDPESITPGAAAAAGWVPDTTNGVASVAMSSTNVTLTPVQYGKPMIALTGTLTASLNLVFPNIAGSWIVTNNCTGAYTVTCKTASGTGVALNAGQTLTVFGDDTNIYPVGYSPSIAQAPYTVPESDANGTVSNYMKGGTLYGYGKNVFSLGTLTASNAAISLSNATVFTAGLSSGLVPGKINWTFLNPRPLGLMTEFEIHLTNGGLCSQNFLNSMMWPAGNAPSWSSSGLDIVKISTSDSGNSYQATIVALNLQVSPVATGELGALLALTSQGAVEISSNTTLYNALSIDGFYRAKFSSLTIDGGATLTLANRGVMSILVTGNCVINGTISMSAKGAIGTGQPVSYSSGGGPIKTIIAAIGGAGGAAQGANGAVQTNASGNPGAAGSVGQSGGGGSGGAFNQNASYLFSGAGGNGTSFSGGPGGGGLLVYEDSSDDYPPTPGSNTGGSGGSGGGQFNAPGSGGAGNPGGTSPNGGSTGGTGTGGTIVLFVQGNLTVGPTGSLIAAGVSGGTNGGGGGGSGGGSIQVFYGGTLSYLGSMSAPGGAGGPGGGPGNGAVGGAGGAGNCRITTI